MYESGGKKEGWELELLVRTKFVVTISLDPLGIPDTDLADVKPPELELSRYGFTGRDLDKEITLGFGILPHFTTEENKIMKLREIIKVCKRIYWESDFCVRKNQLSLIISFIGRAVAIQCIHIPDKEQGDWIRERLEVAKPWSSTPSMKKYDPRPPHLVRGNSLPANTPTRSVSVSRAAKLSSPI
jgi:2-oxoglutarate dehydrogenase complex dehydrogenase (E1) component-like enzyme